MASTNKASTIKNTSRATYEQDSNYLKNLELELKNIWTQYWNCLEKEGSSENAKAMKQRYYSLYRTYRQKKEWNRSLTRTKMNGLLN